MVDECGVVEPVEIHFPGYQGSEVAVAFEVGESAVIILGCDAPVVCRYKLPWLLPLDIVVAEYARHGAVLERFRPRGGIGGSYRFVGCGCHRFRFTTGCNGIDGELAEGLFAFGYCRQCD